MVELSKTSNKNFLKTKYSTLTGSAKWADIADLINRWAMRRPQQAYEFEQYIKEMRSVAKDPEHGFIDGRKSSKGVNSGGTRLGISLPTELMNYIQAFYPTFMDTKDDLHEFKKRFPKFRVPQK